MDNLSFPSGVFPKILISGDYNAFDEGWNGCGVYACSGLYQSQTFRIPWYIGSTDDLQWRLENGHISLLSKNKHYNNPLQLCWNKHNEKEGFVWWVLELCDVNETFEREQYYFDLHRPFVDEFGGFNIDHFARGVRRGKSNRIKTPEERAKMSQARRGVKMPKRHGEKTRKRMTGKIGADSTAGKEYSLLSPNHEIITFKSMANFCKENNLDKRSVFALLQGERKVKGQMKIVNHVKGWRRVEDYSLTPEEIKLRDGAIKEKNKQGIKEYWFLKDGKIVKIKNLAKFCRENDLLRAPMGNVYYGTGGYKSYKGYVSAKHLQYPSEEPPRKQIKPNQKNLRHYRLIDPNGVLIEGKNLNNFAQENDLSPSHLRDVISGKRPHHKGYTAP